MSVFSNVLGYLIGFGIFFPLILALIVATMLWRAWWFYPAWGWFLVPLGVPQISFWHFTTLMLLVSVLTSRTDTKKDERKEDWAKVVILFIAPMLTWALLRWMR